MEKFLENTSLPTYELSAPTWLPESLKAKLRETGRLELIVSFPPALRKILRKRKKIPVSEWAEKHRVVTLSSREGPWRNETTPYLAGVMDAAGFESVRTIIVCAAPQVGKTEAVNNFVGYTIDRDPGPVLYVYPDRDTAKENSRDRIQPMIETSPRLRSYMTGSDEDVTAMRIKLQHMPIYMAWARSASRLANKPIRYVIFDETDKYPDTAGKRETDPISLGEKRVTTYRGKEKIFKMSTPTVESGPIWQALTKEAQVTFDFWVQCPHCGELQLMEFDQIKWKKGADGEHPDPEHVEAWYECPHCHETWDDDYRNKAVRAGEWRARGTGEELFKYLKKYRPEKIGFLIPSWLSYFVRLYKVAAAFIKGLKSKTKLKDFMNNHKAEPWVEYTVERDEDVILALRDDRPRGLVPGGGVVAGLTAAVDTQDNGFYYEIRAWGWGLIQESWQIREGFALSFEALEQILFNDSYLDADGKQYIIQGFIIDAMGHRTKEVYEWCSLHRRVFPFKGEDRMNQPYTFTKLEYYPGTKKPIPGGLQLLRANVNYYKDDLANKLEIAPADPGAWHLHSECSRDWAVQMIAEYVNEKGVWECRDGAANHAWDVSVYNLVIADVIGIKYWKKPEEKTTANSDKTAIKNNKPNRRGRRW